MREAWFTVREIYPGIWGIGEFGHNELVISYLLLGKEKALLFDSGMGIGNIREEVARLTKLPVLLINSHCHFDHVGGNSSFEEIAIFETESSRRVAENGYANSQLRHAARSELFSFIPEDFDPEKYRISPFSYSHVLSEGEEIDIAPFHFVVIHSPGHSPDSICLCETNRKLLLAGDTLYPGPIYLQLTDSDVEQYIRSIEKLSKLAPINDILPAHNAFHMSPEYIKLILDKLAESEAHAQDAGSIVVDERVSILLKRNSH